MSPIAWIMAGLVALAPAAYAYGVIKTRAEERAACRAQIVAEVQKVAAAMNADTEAKIADAMRAADAVTATPSGRAELMKLCQSDPACREHKP